MSPTTRTLTLTGLWLAAMLLALAGCVVESVTPVTGLGAIRPSGRGASVSRVRMAVSPLGTVEYDGQVLPLISPDGAWMAVQQGQAPSWPALLAEPTAEPPLLTTLAVYDLRTAPLRPAEQAVTAPSGTVLGRSADRDGVLVERLLDDGSRWIGHLAWRTGEVEWLVADEHINAHATLGPRGELAWIRRRRGIARPELVLRTSARDRQVERRWTPARGEPAFPIFGGWQRKGSERLSLWVLVVADRFNAQGAPVDMPREDVRLAVIELKSESPSLLSPRLAGTLSEPADIQTAYQACSTTQTPPPPTDVSPAHGGFEGIALFSASRGAMVWICGHPLAEHDSGNRALQADITTLGSRSLGAALGSTLHPAGLFTGSPTDLQFFDLPEREGEEPIGPPIGLNVLSGQFLPIRLIGPDAELALIGLPQSGESDRLQILRAKPLAEAVGGVRPR